jgi:hypothetical protein
VTATNHAELLDRAVWRRFQLRLGFPQPTSKQVAVFLDRKVRSWPNIPRMSANKMAARLGSVSYAEALDFCQNVRRREILSLGALGVDTAVEAELSIWDQRVKAQEDDGDPTRNATTESYSGG